LEGLAFDFCLLIYFSSMALTSAPRDKFANRRQLFIGQPAEK
jgi:hypothetical protein